MAGAFLYPQIQHQGQLYLQGKNQLNKIHMKLAKIKQFEQISALGFSQKYLEKLTEREQCISTEYYLGTLTSPLYLGDLPGGEIDFPHIEHTSSFCSTL